MLHSSMPTMSSATSLSVLSSGGSSTYTSRLARAKEAGILQAVDSDVLEAKVPGYIQDSDNQWFGFSQRARIIFFDKNDVTNPPRTYLDLADPAYKGKVCIRSSTNTYNQTLLASIVTHHGSEVAADWAKGVVANMARLMPLIWASWSSDQSRSCLNVASRLARRV